MIKIQCDTCGTQEETSRVTVQVPAPLPIFRETPVPDGWRRVQVPMPDGELRKREVCPDCLRRLWDLFGVPYDRTEPTKCVRCGHAPSTHGGSSDCGVIVDGRACGCELSPVECLDGGWARTPDSDHLHDFGQSRTVCARPGCDLTWGEFRRGRKQG